jgi:hypothetical protein
LFLSILLAISTRITHAQAPAAGASVTVQTADAIDSSADPAGKQYRATVTKAVDAGNGVTIPQGAIAAVTLVKNASAGWTTQIVSVAINGRQVAVTGASTSLTGATQSAAGNALGSINSVLGGFGQHLNAPASATAMATGQRVVLPPGSTLSFVLSQPPAGSPATPAVAAASEPVAAPGQDWWMCRYRDVTNPSNPALGSRMYYALFPTSATVPNGLNAHFNAYVQQNYQMNDHNNSGNGYCRRFSNDAATRANSMDMLLKQFASSNIESIHIDWADTPAQDAAIDAKLAAAAAATPRPAATASGGPFISCSTSGGAGIDTYLTGVFQTTRPVQHLPSGGNLVDQSVLDDFYAYLKQKGYSFKPGSNYGCDVQPTEAAAKAAQHKRAYEGGACSTCGKIVETGWKE